ncbi:YceI family protein [Lutibacter sp.]|uniref:YceI family protein n=1 Tax=Lutibacter sp. TaxID=1925666 RepID=UPI0038CD5677
MIALVLLLVIGKTKAQNKYFTVNGTINFEASVPSFEEVKAKNTTVSAIFNISTGEIASLALVKAFRFKVALMEEHFNESYAHSKKFPKATFSGKIENFDKTMLNKNTLPFKANGILYFHGKSVLIKPIVYISKYNNTIHLTSKFNVNPEDFNIKLPKIIRKKVAKTVMVKINFTLEPKN